MKNLILFLLFFVKISTIQSQITKTIVKNIVTQTNNIEVAFNCEKEIKYWDKDQVKLVLDITVNKKEQILSALIKLGRYSFMETTNDNTLYVHIPKLEHHIFVAGLPFEEKLYLTIWLPKNMEIKSKQITL
jgi:hypothetical protein